MKIFKLKADKVEKFRAWTAKVRTELHDEAVDTLQEEGCTHEIFELFEINGDMYVVAHMEGNNITPSNQEREINRTHRAIMQECIESVIPTQVLYDLKAPL